MSQSQGIVTPEAVLLEFETAGVGSRMLAAALDLVIRILLLFALIFASLVVGRRVHVVGTGGVYLALFGFFVGYSIGFETLWKGRTPGKAALGLRVVTVEGAPVRFRHAAIRGALALVEIQTYVLAFIPLLSIFFSRRNQRLGDMAAGTVVLRERTGAARPAPVSFTVPYGYEPYAATLDISGLTATDYGAIRSFLLRAGSLDPPRRFELARQLATPMLARLRHTPPPGIGPEALLACVAAMYQRRPRTSAPLPSSSWSASPAPPGYWGAPSGYGPAPGSAGYAPAPGYGPPAASGRRGDPPGYGPPSGHSAGTDGHAPPQPGAASAPIHQAPPASGVSSGYRSASEDGSTPDRSSGPPAPASPQAPALDGSGGNDVPPGDHPVGPDALDSTARGPSGLAPAEDPQAQPGRPAGEFVSPP